MFILAISTISTVIWIHLSGKYLGLNSIYAISTAFLIIGIMFSSIRNDLFIPAVMGGVLFALITFAIFQTIIIFSPSFFVDSWKLNFTWRPFVFGIPAQELIWAFTWGFVATPAYELTFGLKLEDKK